MQKTMQNKHHAVQGVCVCAMKARIRAMIQFTNHSSPVKMFLECLPARMLLHWMIMVETRACPLISAFVGPPFMTGWARFQECWLGLAVGRSTLVSELPPTPAIPLCPRGPHTQASTKANRNGGFVSLKAREDQQ